MKKLNGWEFLSICVILAVMTGILYMFRNAVEDHLIIFIVPTVIAYYLCKWIILRKEIPIITYEGKRSSKS